MNRFIDRNKLAVALIISGLIFIFRGFLRGEVRLVFIKAVSICLECIGIG